MDKHIARLNAMLAGAGSAFALLPTGALEQYTHRESTESRIYNNFARVGERLDAAMNKVADEQKERAK